MPLALQIAERLVSIACEENNEHSFIQPRLHLQSQRKAPWGRVKCARIRVGSNYWARVRPLRSLQSPNVLFLISSTKPWKSGSSWEFSQSSLFGRGRRWSPSSTQRKNLIVGNLCVVLRFSSLQTVVVLQ